jgi:hypothetical protein
MNAIITHRTNPNVRHKIKGILLAEKLNKHIAWKKQVDKVMRFLIENNINEQIEFIIEE